jgi:hypothetical protein
MYQDEVVLCGSSAYTRKFYLNSDFEHLPAQVKDELKILCVLYTEDVGGTLQLVFDAEGSLTFRTECEENDFMYDEIGSVLKVKQLQQTKKDLLEALEMFYKVFFLGAELEEDQGCY